MYYDLQYYDDLFCVILISCDPIVFLALTSNTKHKNATNISTRSHYQVAHPAASPELVNCGVVHLQSGY